MPTKIFVDLTVKDLDQSKAFYQKLGYCFDPKFTNDDAAALVISDTIFAMLHTPKSFARFLPKGKTASDATTTTEVLLALSADSKDAVNALADKALAAGATPARPPEDHCFM